MRKPFLMILTLICLIAATTDKGRSGDMEQVPAEYALYRGLSYSDADPKLTLDLFLPLKAPKPMPCVVVIQGGGFMAQNGQRFRPFAEHLANNGIAAALISYRGLPDHPYRETVADIKTAVRFLRRISNDFGIDSDRIGAMGRSAGATLAALLAVSTGIEESNKGGHKEFSKAGPGRQWELREFTISSLALPGKNRPQSSPDWIRSSGQTANG